MEFELILTRNLEDISRHMSVELVLIQIFLVLAVFGGLFDDACSIARLY